MNIGECSDGDFHSSMNNNIDFIFDDIDSLVDTYPMFKATLASMEDKQIDAFEEHQAELCTEFLRVLDDTFKKAFGSIT